jgi:predicted enzyme related to lactoylglutathione lyase
LYPANDDTDATAAKVTASGGILLAEPFDVPGNGRMTVATDPAGAAFGVCRPVAAGGCRARR